MAKFLVTIERAPQWGCGSILGGGLAIAAIIGVVALASKSGSSSSSAYSYVPPSPPADHAGGSTTSNRNAPSLTWNAPPSQGVGAVQPPVLPKARRGSWYAIGASLRSESAADEQARSLGAGWRVVSNSDCPNFAPGVWAIARGPFDTAEIARSVAGPGGYPKSCY